MHCRKTGRLGIADGHQLGVVRTASTAAVRSASAAALGTASTAAQLALESEKNAAVAALSAASHAYQTELAALQREIQAMRRSHSWRLTYPLRIALIRLRARLSRRGRV